MVENDTPKTYVYYYIEMTPEIQPFQVMSQM